MGRTSPLFLALSATVACVHQVNPTVTPEKIPPVSPAIQAHAILLIAPSFEDYTSASSSGIHQYKYHFGQSATVALTDLVRESFTRGETRHVTDAEVLQILSGPADTMMADLLLVPAFEAAGSHDRFLDIQAEVKLRMSVRSFSRSSTHSWVTLGGSTRVISSRGGLTGSALEGALKAMSDSLAAHRSDLEVAAPAN